MRKLIAISCLIFTVTMSYSQIQAVYDATKAENKFVYNDKYIKLFLGDEVFIQAEVSGDTISKLIVVPEIKNPLCTIVIKFKTEYFGIYKSTIMHITSPFEKRMTYHACIQRNRTSAFENTSVLDLFRGIPSREQWPYRIESIILSDFELK
jgi:hypothetical protein